MTRFVYFGTPQVARETLAYLLEHGLTPTLVVTSPDAPQGRGLELTPTPVKTLAAEHEIPYLTPEKLDPDTIASIRAYDADYGICVAYGKIFPEALINTFPQGVLNVHYSLLPKYRGATPLEGALLAGERETGVTIQKMVKALDAGDIVAQRAFPVGETETARELRPRLIALGAELLAETLPDYLSGALTPTRQDESLATHSGKLRKADGQLDLTSPAFENWCKYRAYADTIGTHFFKDGKRVKIMSATYKNNAFIPLRVIPEGKSETDYANL